jgi:hypothetical protein
MHELLGFKNYDHEDRNEFNNRKENLRKASRSEQCQNRSLFRNNTSGVTGVSLRKEDNMWKAQLQKDGKIVLFEYFINKEEAIKARLKAEKEYFDDFAPQKHLFQQYDIN